MVGYFLDFSPISINISDKLLFSNLLLFLQKCFSVSFVFAKKLECFFNRGAIICCNNCILLIRRLYLLLVPRLILRSSAVSAASNSLTTIAYRPLYFGIWKFSVKQAHPTDETPISNPIE